MSEPFRVVVGDPAWSFSDRLSGRRGAESKYPVMSVDDICNIVLPPIAADAVLFLWRVSSQVEEAYRVVRAWGFVPKSEIVWVKTAKAGDPAHLAFGMGRSVRASHETCIIATRGRPVRLSASVRSVFHAPRLTHSEKPGCFHGIVESLYAGPYVELFARREREGWTTVGHDVGSTLEVRAA
jgi:N6-adenosine-specific RNA methylase IME4